MIQQYDLTKSIDRLKESFLYAAAQGGNNVDCDSLLALGADVNWKGPEGDTPLLAAVRKGHLDTASLLLAYGADANIIGGDGLMPIHVAAKRGDYNTLNLLLEVNADTSARSSDGQTALDIAKAKGFEDIYGKLMQPGIIRRGPIEVIRNRTADSSGAFSNSINDTSSSSSSGRDAIESLPPAAVPSRRQQLPSLSASNDSIIMPSAATDENSRRVQNDSMSSSISSSGSGSSSSSDIVTKRGSASSRKLNSIDDGKQTSLSNKQSSVTIEQLAATLGSDRQQSYSIQNKSNVGHSSNTAFDETSVALQKILETEMRERQKAEAKVLLLQEQNMVLSENHLLLQAEVGSLKAECMVMEEELGRLSGAPAAVAKLAMDQCEMLEKQLQASLVAVDKRKAAIIRDEIGQHKEQRLCIICQEHEKSVVLLPCRHMCLCESCSLHDQLVMCPLCRRAIAHKISVFS